MVRTAQQLVTSPSPSQADLRRAISTAYYALFHMLSKTATERFIGTRLNDVYESLYRSVEHSGMRRVCETITTPQIGQPYAKRLGFAVPTQGIRAFGTAFIELQQSRHEADYNPREMHNLPECLSLVQTAEDAIARFLRIPVQDQNAILICMLVSDKKR